MAGHLQRAEPELLRSMLLTFVQALMTAEVDATCGAGYGERSPERTNSTQRLPDPRLRHPRRNDAGRDPQAA
jgi:transposase-like protein